jgi:hypothetical protein
MTIECTHLGMRIVSFCIILIVVQTKQYTIKTPNFGPHGNFGPLFQKSLLSLQRILQKSEENKSCRKRLDLKICFCSYFVHDSSKEATVHAKKVQSFHQVQN